LVPRWVMTLRTPPLARPSVGAIRRIGQFQRLTAAPVRSTSFVDESVDLETPQTVEGDPIYDRNLHSEHLDLSGRPYTVVQAEWHTPSVGGISTSLFPHF